MLKSTRPSPPGRAARGPALDLGAANITAMTDIMNPHRLKKGVDLKEIEDSVKGHPPAASESAPASSELDRNNRVMQSFAEDLGFSLEGVAGFEDLAPPPPPPQRPPAEEPVQSRRGVPKGSTIDDLLRSVDLGDSSDESDDDDHRPLESHGAAARGGDESDDSDDSDDSDESDDGRHGGHGRQPTGGFSSGYAGLVGRRPPIQPPDTSSDSEEEEEALQANPEAVASGMRGMGVDTDTLRARSLRRRTPHQDTEFPSVGAAGWGARAGWDGADMSPDAVARRRIDEAFALERGETFTAPGADRIRERDAKNAKLEQIAQLRISLDEEGVDCKNIPVPTVDSTNDEIDAALSFLQLKHDRIRYSTLAEEIIISGVEGLEWVLDGTREIPIVGWRPDYTGYSQVAKLKLYRMRSETSQIASRFIGDNRISPAVRIGMELLPSFLMYPRTQKKQRGSPGIQTDLRRTPTGYRESSGAAMATLRGQDFRF